MDNHLKEARRIVNLFIHSQRMQITIRSAKIYAHIAVDLLIQEANYPNVWQDVKSKIDEV